ncbi:MAG: hypothetical protein JXB48_21005 [Candidatus Latescibacteria bacterium]|nr:hypothetical protein [Candidatus Latescibacterota bacterium]
MSNVISRREALLFTALGAMSTGSSISYAQGASGNRKSVMKYVRCYADADGESHLEDVELDMPVQDFGTANVPDLAMTKSLNASKIFFVRVEANKPEHREMDWHTPPDRRFGIWLEGETEIITSDGDIRHLGPGDVALAEDTTGKGHRSRNLRDVLIAFVTLSEES